MNGKSLIKTGIGVGVGIALLAGVACGQGEYKTPTLSNNTTTTISKPTIDKKFSLEEVLTLAKIQPDFVEELNYLQNTKISPALRAGFLIFYKI